MRLRHCGFTSRSSFVSWKRRRANPRMIEFSKAPMSRRCQCGARMVTAETCRAIASTHRSLIRIDCREMRQIESRNLLHDPANDAVAELQDAIQAGIVSDRGSGLMTPLPPEVQGFEAHNHVPACTLAYSDGQGETCGFPHLRQPDIPGLRAFRAFPRTRQSTIHFRNQ